jgi:hypothetical protein
MAAIIRSEKRAFAVIPQMNLLGTHTVKGFAVWSRDLAHLSAGALG